MMPGLTASMLVCGLAGAFTGGGLRYIWFVFGAIIQAHTGDPKDEELLQPRMNNFFWP